MATSATYSLRECNHVAKDVVHRGGCHCGAVRFEFVAPSDLVAWDCNCSICSMRRNTHVVVPENHFRLLCGEAMLQEYKFGTGGARHLFCKLCGICSFYRPRSNPNAFAITIHCVDPSTVSSVVVRCIDGRNWERAVPASGIQSLA